MEIVTSTGDMFEVVLMGTKRGAKLSLRMMIQSPIRGWEKRELLTKFCGNNELEWGQTTQAIHTYSTCGTAGSGLQCYYKVLYGGLAQA